ncbi:MAG: CsgG/HfaB family protein [Spirochaetaceae bacterium]|nr:CsgG/HfaB family protein [Spirochaetaceae bacterium]
MIAFMNPRAAWGIVAAVALAMSPALAAQATQTAQAAPAANARLPLVIAAFKDLGTPKEKLGEAVAQAIMVGLDDCEHIRPLERAELDKILAEIELGMSGLVDESTAARAGSLIGAKYMVFGAVAQIGAVCQVTWRIIHVETGEQLDAGKSRGSKDQLFDLADALAAQIDEAVGSL